MANHYGNDQSTIVLSLYHTFFVRSDVCFDWYKLKMSCFLSTGIFGQRLEDTVQYERKFGPRLVPLLVEQCVDFIREQGLDEEGLFRMPGQANLVKELQEAFDCGDKPQFDRYYSEHRHGAINRDQLFMLTL